MTIARLLLSVLFTWICPGLGHFYLGRRRKAAYFFVLIVGLFVAGMVYADFRNISIRRHPYFSIAYGFMALPTAVAMLLTQNLAVEHDLNPDLGCLLSAVAALLNILVMIDAYTLAEGDKSRELSGRPARTA